MCVVCMCGGRGEVYVCVCVCLLGRRECLKDSENEKGQL